MVHSVFDDRQVAQFHRDGYVLVRGLFDAEEMKLLREACRVDKAIRENAMDTKDGEGGSVRLALWNEAGEDIYGLISRSRRIVDSVEKALDGEVYHWHSKMIEKDPFTGGAWRWHQDYGYWYYDNCLLPDMASCMIAIDPATQENGCLQVLKGSHAIGRIDHNKSGDQAGAEMGHVEAAEKMFERVYCEMASGDAIIFHANLLHRSDQNRSPHPRWAFISCYNTARNTPFKESRHASYKKLEKVEDGAIKAAGLRIEEKVFYARDTKSGY